MMSMPDVELERAVATHTAQISNLAEGQRRIETALDRFESKMDKYMEITRWSPTAKAAVIAPAIMAIGGLIGLAISNGGPT